MPEAQDCVTPEDVMELVPSTPVLLLRFKPHAPEFEMAALERFIELSCKETPFSLELDMATRSISILLPTALIPSPLFAIRALKRDIVLFLRYIAATAPVNCIFELLFVLFAKLSEQPLASMPRWPPLTETDPVPFALADARV